MNLFIEDLKNILTIDQIKENELMKHHTTFRIGGSADVMIMPNTEEEIVEIISLSNKHNIPYTILGNGSNVLVTDKGIRGLVIKIADNFSDVQIEGNLVYAQSGARLTAISRKIYEAELTGFEFASGIPGTVGGGVYMNAGAYDSEMKNIIKTVRALDKTGNIIELSNEEMHFGYRKSRAMEDSLIILSVVIELKHGDKAAIKAKIDDFTNKRVTKQPVSEFSAGSTFKRPEGHFAGKLIEETGLRGYTIGHAKISEKHCGFVINKGDSTCEDMLEFIQKVKHKVYEKTGVKLEEEIKIIGEK